jgi:hypothetical protein
MDFSNVFPTGNGKPDEGLEAFDAAEAAPEFEPIPTGTYVARVAHGECRLTKKGAPGYRLRFEVTEGEFAGKTVIRTWTFGVKAIGHTKRELEKFGLTTRAQLESPFPEPGREYVVQLKVALQVGDDGITQWNDVKKIDLLKVTESPAARFMLPDSSEGGLK